MGISEVWDGVKWLVRTSWPLMLVKTHNYVLDEYETHIERQSELIDAQADELDRLAQQLDDLYPLPPLEDWSVTIPGVAEVSVTHDVYTDDDHAIANMENDGVCDPNHYRED